MPTVSPRTTQALPVVTVADADEYFLTSFNGRYWAALEPEQKELALAEAKRWLMTICWNPDADCCADFEHAYTAAVSELALALHQNQSALITGPAAPGPAGPIRRQALEGLQREFFPPSEGNTMRFSASAPLVLQKFPWLWDIAGCWMMGVSVGSGYSRILPRLRN